MNSFWKTNATEFVVADWQQLKFVWRHCISCVFGTRTLFRTYVCVKKKTIQTCSKFVKLDTNHKTKHEFNCVFYQSISFKNPLYVKLYLQIRIFSYVFFSKFYIQLLTKPNHYLTSVNQFVCEWIYIFSDRPSSLFWQSD